MILLSIVKLGVGIEWLLHERLIDGCYGRTMKIKVKVWTCVVGVSLIIGS